VKYIHLNPVRPRDKREPVPAERRAELADYPWSSHRAYAGVAGVVVPNWLCLDWLSDFGRTRRVAREAYRRQMDQAFGAVVRCPWEGLRQGLVLGGESLWNRARQLLEHAAGDEEIRWRRRADAGQLSARIASLVASQSDRRVAPASGLSETGCESRRDSPT
jgi:hypothetical protein